MLNRVSTIVYGGSQVMAASMQSRKESASMNVAVRAPTTIHESYKKFTDHFQAHRLDYLIPRLPGPEHIESLQLEEDGSFEARLKKPMDGQIVRKDRDDWRVPGTAVKVHEIIRGRLVPGGVEFEAGIGGCLQAPGGIGSLHANVTKVFFNKQTGKIACEAKDTIFGYKIRQEFYPSGNQTFFDCGVFKFKLDPQHVHIEYEKK